MGENVKCPMCKKKFELEDDLNVGDSTYCAECYEELHIISLNPPKVEVVESKEEESYEDEENDDNANGKEDWE